LTATVVALKGFYERHGHAVAQSGAVSAWEQADVSGKGARVAGDVARAVVADEFKAIRAVALIAALHGDHT
jgi:hypothetical protein